MRSIRFWWLAATIVLVPARSLRAASPEHRAELSLDGRVGQSTAPYPTRAFPHASGYGASFILGGRFRVAPQLDIGLRAPLALMRVEQPAGALYAEAAWGNPELYATFWHPWLEHFDRRLRLATSVAVGVPVAEHDPAQLAGRTLCLANALEGSSEPALFTPGVAPVTPSGTLIFQNSRWKLSALLALPFLFRVSNADLPPESQPRRLGISTVATAEAQWRLTRWLALAAAPRLTVRVISSADDHASPIQVLASGRADAALGQHATLSALLQAPVGGSLGGSTVAGGLRLSSAF